MKQIKCEFFDYCGNYALKESNVCRSCADALELDSLVEMYGEEDGSYFAAIDHFPGE